MDERSDDMDFIPPDHQIFPLQQSDEPLFQASSTSSQQYYIDPHQDTLPMTPLLDYCTDFPLKLDIPEERSHKAYMNPNSLVETSNEKKKKKIVHREVERQRRQEMANLYASLRQQLPLEYLKGKRSISDHMNEATNYIRDLQEKIQQLNEKRDRLSKMNSAPPDMTSNDCRIPDSVSVRPCCSGVVEVFINSSLRNEEFPLSKVLRLLTNQGFSIVSCFSNTVNERSLHTIQSEVSDMESIDLSGLQQMLTDFLVSGSN